MKINNIRQTLGVVTDRDKYINDLAKYIKILNVAHFYKQ